MNNSNTPLVTSSLITSPHGFSTRQCGVSNGIYSSLNLGMNRGDDKESVIKNWDIFLKACGITNEKFVCGRQVHGNYVHIATEDDLRPAYGAGELIDADGYVTNRVNVPIAVFTADCVPLLLEDPVNKVIGAIHCGWRSTVADIEANAISAMQSLGSHAKDIRAAIGPAIGYCCFEVGPEVIEGINQLLDNDTDGLYQPSSNEGKYMLDLRSAVKRRLIQLGLAEQNIDIIKDCTMCSPSKYWSHRYTNGERGSQADIICLTSV